MYGQELLDGGFVAIGWREVGDLAAIGNDQARMRDALTARHPDAKPGAIANWAGTLRRFAFEARTGDLVVFPNKQDRTLNFGRLAGPYQHHAADPLQPNRRPVEWLRTGVARSLFSQGALWEVGSALTMFAVRNHTEEFLAFLASHDDQQFVETLDFIADALLSELSHEEFEQFVADLLRCLGYQARVTRYGGDGGVDVIAHKDLLGLEPPVIKVQYKHTSTTQGRPVVQQLIGTLAHDEAGLFVTLGTYSAEALAVERERQNLRLFSGADITDLAIRHYDELAPKWRSLFPLRRVWAVDT